MQQIELTPGSFLYALYHLALSIRQSFFKGCGRDEMPERTTTCAVVGNIFVALGCVAVCLALIVFVLAVCFYLGYVLIIGWKLFSTLLAIILGIYAYNTMSKDSTTPNAQEKIRTSETTTLEFARIAMRSWRDRMCTAVHISTPRHVDNLEWMPHSSTMFAILLLSVLALLIAVLVHMVIASATIVYTGPCTMKYEFGAGVNFVGAQCNDMETAWVMNAGELLPAIYNHTPQLNCSVSNLGIKCQLP